MWKLLHLSLNKKNGMTLIELLIGMVMATIIAITIGVVLMRTSSMYREMLKKLNLEKEASYSLMKIEKDLRVKTPDDIEIMESGTKLVLDKNNDNSPYFQKIDNNLVYYDGNETKTLIKDNVSVLSFEYYTEGEEVKYNLIKINLTLSDGKHEYNIETMVKLRNG